MSSDKMRKLMTLLEGTIHGDSDGQVLVQAGWSLHPTANRWHKEGYPFLIDIDHLESLFVYDWHDQTN